MSTAFSKSTKSNKNTAFLAALFPRFKALFVKREDGYVKFLTKGDNNSVDDRGLYSPGQFWLERKDVIGKAKGFVPYIGIVTILMNDYPQLKVSCRAGLSAGL